MRKRTRNVLALITISLIIGFAIGFLIPWDIRELTQKKLDSSMITVANKLGQLDQEGPGFRYATLADVDSGSVTLLRVDENIPLHKRSSENRFVYFIRGKAKGSIGDTSFEAGPGQLLLIPAGVLHYIEKDGDSPPEVIVFSTPSYNKDDTIWVNDQ
jgi:mannose-6-phosphate isomerase-like protein (cupin superfamily)